MPFFDRPWFTLGVLIAIALFATVGGLTVQLFFGRNIWSVLIGQALAIAGVLAFFYLQKRNAEQKLK